MPGFFFMPFVFACSGVELTLISHVGGNSMGHNAVDDRKLLGV